MLVVVDLLDVEVLPRFEVHDVHIEVVVARRRQQLAQVKHLARARKQRLIADRAVLEHRLATLATKKLYLKAWRNTV